MDTYHYVYLISNTRDSMYYIGSRKSRIQPTDDLGKIYFSSSRDHDFLALQKSNPELFEYHVIETFKTMKDAIEFECRLHEYFDVGRSLIFYNKARQTSTKFTTSGAVMSKEHRRKISDRLSGRRQSKEWIEKRTGKIVGENNGMYGKNYLEVWIERYGYDEAIIKYENLLDRRVRGKNNPCYGKYGKDHPASKSYLLSNGSTSESFERIQDLIDRCEELGIKWNTLRLYSAKGKTVNGYTLKSY